MAATPDSSVVDEVNSGDEDPVPPRGAGKENGPCSDRNPVSGAGARPHRERTPEPPNPVDQLIAALCEATLNPACPGCHGLDPFPDEDRRRPKVKIPPPIFKGVPGERHDAHLLAAADWMEAM